MHPSIQALISLGSTGTYVFTMAPFGQIRVAVVAVLSFVCPFPVLSFTPDASSLGKQSQQVATDRQSSSLRDLDRISELDQRIEDGIHYEHGQDDTYSYNRHCKTIETDDSIPTARGIFCGYRCTHEDYRRLKSANVA